ncbi:MAG: hypothetical protein ACRCXT_19280 [Paraclostridium sp.]
MEKLQNSLFTTNYTYIEHEKKEDQKYNAPHHFNIRNKETDELLTAINIQEGPIKECGINGCGNEDLIAIVLERLISFQNTEYACKENAMTITKLEEAVLWLRKRTMGREQRGVVGTSEK